MSALVPERLANDLKNAQQTLDRIPESLAEVRDRVADSPAVETLQQQAGVAVDRLQEATDEVGEQVRRLRDHPVAIGVGAVAVGCLVAALVLRRNRRDKYAGQAARLE